MRFGQKTLRRLLSDRKSRDCPAVYQATATEQHLTSEGRGGDGGEDEAVCQTILHTHQYIYGEHIIHE